ncbi:histidine phosphatase family protein [Maricaulis sp.]|uniref:SixA phosphatase family protein n=1 Tax=Maricaulis sp. TaxID=1486257 RepID=UPI001B108ECA|nr:histidine phosphatase family protein [Maricaulis sp.]MBO6763984.1 histidine phosphatase family protein [Maricaulis sp.]
MTTTLILMRHAKAVDRLEAENDFQRGLTTRGREDSAAAGEALAGRGIRVDLALVSPAWRTRQTYDQMLPQIGEPQMDDPMALYHASTEMLERATRQVLGTAGTILLVGHNPGIGGFAHKLAQMCGETPRMPLGYPTATASIFMLDDDDLSRPRLDFVINPKA